VGTLVFYFLREDLAMRGANILFNRSKWIFVALVLVLAQLAPIVSFSNVAKADDTGFKTPTSTHSPNEWDTNTVANIQSSDNVYISDNDDDDEQGYSNFNFGSIPANAVIDGIEAKIEAKSTDNNGCSIQIRLSGNNGSNYTSSKSVNLDNTDDTTTLGSSSDKWGGTWTNSSFTNANFVVKIININGPGNCSNDSVASVDVLSIKIYYTIPPEPTTPTTNPSLGLACGLDIALVIDNSTSIDSGEMTSMKTALKQFTAALDGTPTEFSVTRFATSASVLQNFTADVTDVDSAIDSVPVGGGFTNWEDGLIKANSTLPNRPNPNLVIFATDGDPTTSNTVGGTDTDQPNAHLDPAVVQANAIKNSGSRILALGIGLGGDSVSRLQAISGPSVNTGNVLTSDVITSNFNQLAADLATFAQQTCGGTITTSKYIDADGDPNTTNDQTLAGSGWEFDINGGSNPGPVQTNAQGITVAVEVTPSAGYSVNETQQPTYELISASCTGASNNGSRDGNSVTGITIAANDIVTCRFVNAVSQGSLTVNKVVENNYGGTTLPVVSFPLFINGNSVTSGQSNNLTAGEYTVTETQQPNYTLKGFTGDCNQNGIVNLGANQNKSCTITNTAIQPKIKVIKTVVDQYGGGKVASDFTMNVSGTDVSTTAGQAGTSTENSVQFAGNASGTYAYLDAGSYTVTETELPGYSASYSEDCSGTIALGQEKICTITNTAQAPGLTVIKKVINNNGGTATADSFTLTAANQSYTGNPTTPTSDGTKTDPYVVQGIQAGQVTISETAKDGYALTNIVCKEGEKTVASNSNQTSLQLNLALGQNVVCTLTNNDIAPSLTLVKKLGETYGSNAKKSDWTLTATGTVQQPTNLSGETGTAGATSGSGFKADTYTLGEQGPSGFVGVWECVNNATNAKTSDITYVTIALGQSYTCTVTNTAIQPKITVIKQVDNGNTGSTLTAGDFTMKVLGSNVSSPSFLGNEQGTTVTLNAGYFAVSEDLKQGYLPFFSGECGGFLQKINVGEHKTCTIKNKAIAPKLTLKKLVINNNGGTAESSDWTLTATPDSQNAPTISGHGGGQVFNESAQVNTTYTLSESGPSGYEAGDWKCIGGNLDGDQLTLELGKSAYCFIVNDDKPGKIVVYKEVRNDDGGEKVASYFSVTVNGVTKNFKSYEENSEYGYAKFKYLDAGWYTVVENEANQDGYQTTYGNCEYEDKLPEISLNSLLNDVRDGEYENGNQEECYQDCSGEVYVANGQTIYCYILNDDVAVDLLVDKDDADALVEAGDSYQYTLKTTNQSEQYTANNVVMIDEIPSSLKVTNIDQQGWICNIAGQDGEGYGGTLTCTLDSLAPGEESDIVTLTVEVKEGTEGFVENTVVVTSDERELNPEDNQDTESTPVKSLEITLLPICRNDFPYLSYDIQLKNFTANQATLEWYSSNPGDNPNELQATQIINSAGNAQVSSFVGEILWPGASLNPVDWPGWDFVDGEWIVTRDDLGGKLRPQARVEVLVNPEIDTTTLYPPATPACNANPPQNQEELVNTGSGDSTLIGVILAALMITSALAMAVPVSVRSRR
jgi:hypothetical protein